MITGGFRILHEQQKETKYALIVALDNEDTKKCHKYLVIFLQLNTSVGWKLGSRDHCLYFTRQGPRLTLKKSGGRTKYLKSGI